MLKSIPPIPHPRDWNEDKPNCTCISDEDGPCNAHDFCTCGTELDSCNWPLRGPWCKTCSASWLTASVVFGLMGMALGIRKRHNLDCDQTVYKDELRKANKAMRAMQENAWTQMYRAADLQHEVNKLREQVCGVQDARAEGAAVAFGLMGMAEAIRFGQMIRNPYTWSVEQPRPMTFEVPKEDVRCFNCGAPSWEKCETWCFFRK